MAERAISTPGFDQGKAHRRSKPFEDLAAKTGETTEAADARGPQMPIGHMV